MTQQQAIKAIETVYNGYRFRSRLEARWAVFFDALGVKYDYEKEGYDLGKAGWYLPDFWLETVQQWAEVKPHALTDEEYEKCALLAQGTGHAVLILVGEPDHHRMYDIVGWGEGRTHVDEIYPGAAIETTYPGGRIEYSVTLDDSKLHEHRWWSAEGHRPNEYDASTVTKTAYITARQARFEHGETPSAPTVAAKAERQRLDDAYNNNRQFINWQMDAYHQKLRELERLGRAQEIQELLAKMQALLMQRRECDARYVAARAAINQPITEAEIAASIAH